MNKTKAFEVFVAVARASSFSHAANDLDTTTSNVSRIIAQLESEVGVRLLHRTTRKVSLTAEGERFFELVDPALRALDEAVDQTTYARDGTSGTIRLATPLAFGANLLVPLIASFHRVNPDVHVDMVLEDQFTDQVTSRIDVGFRIGSEPESHLIARHLGNIELVVCAAPSYVAEHGSPRNLRDLHQHRCTGFRHPHTDRLVPWELRAADGTIAYEKVPAVASFNDVETEVRAVRAGLGIGQLPAFLVSDDLNNGFLLELLPELKTSRLGVYLYYPQRKRVPARVRRLIDFVMAHRLEGSVLRPIPNDSVPQQFFGRRNSDPHYLRTVAV
ncbi:LysR family transcriptional regulator [Paraburkholderia sp. 22B1P]|uniref:LysR family transcriptional regulator n=1 Tax=Paraburkholderia sp. 22B1P TaxID=3080498 RepID=UPI0030889D30|nr:LysR family transcriptional regulator [Paraburkholderia sp. 22B1P]